VARIQKLSKEETLELFLRIIACIKKQKRGYFILKKLKGVHGWCEWDDGIILDYRKDLVPTVIHECIHLLEPNWSEAQVIYSEKRVINTITEDDVIMLLMIFVKKL
jgi:predicted metal-dependent hydrolase